MAGQSWPNHSSSWQQLENFSGPCFWSGASGEAHAILGCGESVLNISETTGTPLSTDKPEQRLSILHQWVVSESPHQTCTARISRLLSQHSAHIMFIDFAVFCV